MYLDASRVDYEFADARARGDRILEVGAGSGFFSFPIAKAIGEQGLPYVTDPSIEQLQSMIAHKKNHMVR